MPVTKDFLAPSGSRACTCHRDYHHYLLQETSNAWKSIGDDRARITSHRPRASSSKTLSPSPDPPQPPPTVLLPALPNPRTPEVRGASKSLAPLCTSTVNWRIPLALMSVRTCIRRTVTPLSWFSRTRPAAMPLRAKILNPAVGGQRNVSVEPAQGRITV